MKTLFFAVLLLSLAFQNCFSQEFEETENWIGEIEGYSHPFLYQRLVYFTKEDVIKAKEKLNRIKSAISQEEWEGVFGRDGELSEIRLIWNSEVGFIDYYIYTCLIELQRLNYGKALNSSDSVVFISEKPLTQTTSETSLAGIKLIKVKVGERRFLVPGNKLADFCEYAVGLSLDNYSASPNFWWKLSDYKKSSFGLPILPEKYKNFLRYPIKAQVTKIGRQEVIGSKNAEGKLEKNAVNYHFTINAGKNNGVKKGMKFYIPEIKEWSEVAGVSLTSSRVYIQRFIGYGEKEVCMNEASEEHECANLALGMTAQTQNNYL
jgi:hypothetical protein